MIPFLFQQVRGRHFWFLFASNFTAFMMMAWRVHERDQIFKQAAGKFDRWRRNG